MADIAISYSHLDELFAGHVRQAFTRLGVTVWMDEAEQGTGGAEGIALPWGQAHWDVITTEFAAADVVVVIDTPNWRASKYCQDEYRFLLEWGMAVEFINAPTSALEAHALDAEAGPSPAPTPGSSNRCDREGRRPRVGWNAFSDAPRNAMRGWSWGAPRRHPG